MKFFIKTNLLRVIIIVGAGLFIMPAFVYATSGACSSHGGVNCTRGMQSSGKVYCNDSWMESMVEYDFMIACKQKDKNIYDTILTIYYKQLRVVDGSYDSYSEIYANCNSKIKFINVTQLSRDVEYCQNIAKQQSSILHCPEDTFIFTDHSEKISISDNWYLPQHCICNGGYHKVDNKCVKGAFDMDSIFVNARLRFEEELNKSSDKLCKQKYGQNSYYENQKCSCLSGYELDVNIASCVPKIVCQLNAHDSNDVCICNDGYLLFEDSLCIIGDEYCKEKFGSSKYKISDNSCICDSGYEFNPNEAACVKLPESPEPSSGVSTSTKTNIVINAGTPQKNIGNSSNQDDNTGMIVIVLLGTISSCAFLYAIFKM